jgi:hypothetical protein
VVSSPRNHLYRTFLGSRQGRPNQGGLFVFSTSRLRKIHHGGQVTYKLELVAIRSSADNDAINQRLDNFDGLRPQIGVCQCDVKVSNSLAVPFCQRWVQPKYGRRGFGEHILDLGLVRFRLF